MSIYIIIGIILVLGLVIWFITKSRSEDKPVDEPDGPDGPDEPVNDYFMRVKFSDVDINQPRPDVNTDYELENCSSMADYELLDEWEAPLFTPEQYALTQGGLNLQIIGKIQTPNVSISLDIAHHKNQESYLAWPIGYYNALFKSASEDFPTFFEEVDGNAILLQNDPDILLNCYTPFSFFVDFILGDEILTLQSNWFIGGEDDFAFNISTPTLVNETDTEVEYAISGEFTADFLKDSDGSIITLTCEFKSPMYITK